MKPSNQKPLNITPPSSARISLKSNNVRTSVCFASIITALTISGISDFKPVDAIIISIVFVYTIASFVILKKASTEKFANSFDQVTMLDATVIGFILSFVQLSMGPTLIFILILQFNSAIHGGTKKCFRDSIAFVFGVALTFLFWEPQWTFSSSASLHIVALIGLFIFFVVYAQLLYSYIKNLEKSNSLLFGEHTLQKLKTYKVSRYVTPTVWHAVNEGRESALKADRKRVTVFFSDIQGFSSLSEELEAETLTGLLNTYLTEMTKIVAQHNGTIDKFLGDGMMVLFGDSGSQSIKNDCVRCVSMSIQMRKKMKELQTAWFNQGFKKPLQVRMGINTGYCTVGTFGTSHYKDYTVVGAHANLASRLESSADAGEILVSHETWSLIKDVILCRDKGDISVKGFSQPVKVYQVVDFRKDLGKNQSYFEENAEGFSMHLDLEKIKNYDKDKILTALKSITEKLKDKII